MSSAAFLSPGGTAQFYRSYDVTLDNGGGTALRYGNVAAGSGNIRMAFSIERQLAGTGARTLTLTNLSPATIRTLRASALGETNEATLVPGTGTRVTVRVGYGGSVNTLFIGSVSKSVTERSGADVHTNLQMIDAESFTRDCVFVRSYAVSTPGVNARQILNDIADAMQVTFFDQTVRVIAGVSLGIPFARYPQGITFNGTCGDALDMLLPPLGLHARIFNGQLEVTPVERYNGRQAFLLTPQTGLLNVPSATINLGRAGVSFTSLMNTRLQPDTLVTFRAPGQHVAASNYLRSSDTLAGYYRVIKATYKGDTHGKDWTVDCEALPYDGPLQVESTPFLGPRV